MDNESEAEGSVAAITLMYAQQPLSFLEGSVQQVDGDNESKEKNLRELLEEQDIGNNTSRVISASSFSTHFDTPNQTSSHTCTHTHTQISLMVGGVSLDPKLLTSSLKHSVPEVSGRSA